MSKTYEAFLLALADSESSRRYDVVNTKGSWDFDYNIGITRGISFGWTYKFEQIH